MASTRRRNGETPTEQAIRQAPKSILGQDARMSSVNEIDVFQDCRRRRVRGYEPLLQLEYWVEYTYVQTIEKQTEPWLSRPEQLESTRRPKYLSGSA